MGTRGPSGIRFLETTVSPAGLMRAGASYVPERLYFAFARYTAARRHRRHRLLLLLLLLLLLQEQRRYAGIDTDVTARTDIDSDAS